MAKGWGIFKPVDDDDPGPAADEANLGKARPLSHWQSRLLPRQWACSSNGRAAPLQGDGSGFESPLVHHEVSRL